MSLRFPHNLQIFHVATGHTFGTAPLSLLQCFCFFVCLFYFFFCSLFKSTSSRIIGQQGVVWVGQRNSWVVTVKLDSFLSPTRLSYINSHSNSNHFTLWEQNSGGSWYISIFHSLPALLADYFITLLLSSDLKYFLPNSYKQIITKLHTSLRSEETFHRLSSYLHLHFTSPGITIHEQSLLLSQTSASIRVIDHIPSHLLKESLWHFSSFSTISFFLSTGSFLRTCMILFPSKKHKSNCTPQPSLNPSSCANYFSINSLLFITQVFKRTFYLWLISFLYPLLHKFITIMLSPTYHSLNLFLPKSPVTSTLWNSTLNPIHKTHLWLAVFDRGDFSLFLETLFINWFPWYHRLLVFLLPH